MVISSRTDWTTSAPSPRILLPRVTPSPAPSRPPPPDVPRVDPAVLRRCPGDFHQFVGRRVAAGRIDERRRHAHRAGPHGRVHGRTHAIYFSRILRTSG